MGFFSVAQRMVKITNTKKRKGSLELGKLSFFMTNSYQLVSVPSAEEERDVKMWNRRY